MIPISVIIPCLNERDRIISTVNIVKAWQPSCQIIVVDDGSTQDSKYYFNQLKNVLLITHPKNLGKSQAICSGLKKATGSIIIFLDADLINLKPSNLDKLYLPILKNKADMVVADYRSVLPKVFRLFYGGQRAFKRTDIISQLKTISTFTGRIPGYMLEPSLNRYFFNRRTAFVNFRNVHHFDENKKSGCIKGPVKYCQNFFTTLNYLGLTEFLRQILFISRNY